MTILNHRTRSKTNASIISMIQRFSDITIIFLGLYVCSIEPKSVVLYEYFVSVLVVLVVFQMIGGITDFYRSWRGVKLLFEIKLVLQNWTLSFIFAIGLLTVLADFNFGFSIYLRWYLFVSVILVLSRMFIRYCAGVIRKLGYNTRRVAVVGNMPVGRNLLKSFLDEPWLGFVVVGIYDSNPVNNDLGVNYIGDLSLLISDAKEGKLDRIYIALSMEEQDKLKFVVKELSDTTCSVMLIPDIFTFNILQSRTEEVNGVPVVPLFDTPLNGINMVLKRLEDIILSSIILIIISPVLFLIAAAVKLTSSGPIIFRQIRYGIDSKPIKVWKFRTMKVMENDSVVKQATKNDIRVTRVGNFLRRTSLDELPQFFNVLQGSMSIVGPRPHAVAHNEQYRYLIEGYMLRHKVKPGITGWAQINGWRGETDTLDKMQKRIEYDLEYIREWSLWLDAKIIILTIFKGFVNKAAY